jgi:hypothetical protein
MAELVGGDRFSFDAELWEWDGQAAWHFVSLPEDLADMIEHVFGQHARGFKSLRVEVTVGSDTWATSLFPDSKRRTYLLPVKKEVRRRQGLVAGSPVTVHITMLT